MSLEIWHESYTTIYIAMKRFWWLFSLNIFLRNNFLHDQSNEDIDPSEWNGIIEWTETGLNIWNKKELSEIKKFVRKLKMTEWKVETYH